MLVCSYNPAYRSSLKELKPSFRQRFVTLPMSYLPPDREAEVIVAEAGIDLADGTAAGAAAPSPSAPPTRPSTSSRRPPGCWSPPRS